VLNINVSFAGNTKCEKLKVQHVIEDRKFDMTLACCFMPVTSNLYKALSLSAAIILVVLVMCQSCKQINISIVVLYFAGGSSSFGFAVFVLCILCH